MLKNGFARKLSSLTASASLFFSAGGTSVRSETRAPTPIAAPPVHRLWRDREHNAVIDVWECPERGLCARIHSVDANNLATRRLVADRLLHKPVEQVTASDVNKLCGRESAVQFNRSAANAFDGNLHLHAQNFNIGMHVEFPDADHLCARIFLPVFGRQFTPLGMNITLEAQRSPVPACQPPRAA